MISVFILSFYLSINRDGVEKFLRAVLPLAWEEYAVDIYLRVRRKMGLWLPRSNAFKFGGWHSDFYRAFNIRR